MCVAAEGDDEEVCVDLSVVSVVVSADLFMGNEDTPGGPTTWSSLPGRVDERALSHSIRSGEGTRARGDGDRGVARRTLSHSIRGCGEGTRERQDEGVDVEAGVGDEVEEVDEMSKRTLRRALASPAGCFAGAPVSYMEVWRLVPDRLLAIWSSLSFCS